LVRGQFGEQIRIFKPILRAKNSLKTFLKSGPHFGVIFAGAERVIFPNLLILPNLPAWLELLI